MKNGCESPIRPIKQKQGAGPEPALANGKSRLKIFSLYKNVPSGPTWVWSS